VNFGFRYHVASLMAVLFSLILGILIGGALLTDHTLVDEQAALIDELEERVGDVQANLALAKEELDLSNFAWDQLLAVISKDSLSEQTIVLVDVDEAAHSSLIALLQSTGADVKEVNAVHLADITPSADHVYVVPLTDGDLPQALQQTIYALSTAGANLSFIWDTARGPSLGGLPESFLVDNIDTAWGKMAFILGLTRGSHGHYGSQKQALGLFP